MQRRTFLAAMAALKAAKGRAAPTRIIDTHTHFYDPTRPQGVPWPPRDDNVLYRATLPEHFQKLTKPLGVTGTVVVEASPWIEDNQWVLDLAARNPVIVGFVGHLRPGMPDFRNHLGRFGGNKLFRGIRIGSSILHEGIARPQFISDLSALADRGLQVDVIGGNPILPDVITLSEKLPELRIVIDHLPFIPSDEVSQRLLARLRSHPAVFAKVSGVLRRAGDRVPADVGFYRAELDELWDVFGAERLVYGSNWPVSRRVAPYANVLHVVEEYFGAKDHDASEKFFWKNSRIAYRWLDR